MLYTTLSYIAEWVFISTRKKNFLLQGSINFRLAVLTLPCGYSSIIIMWDHLYTSCRVLLAVRKKLLFVIQQIQQYLAATGLQPL